MRTLGDLERQILGNSLSHRLFLNRPRPMLKQSTGVLGSQASGVDCDG